MDYIMTTLDNLIHQTAFFNLEVGNYIMIVVACIFLYLAMAKEYDVELPIVFAVDAVVNHGADPKETVNKLMMRKKKTELTK